MTKLAGTLFALGAVNFPPIMPYTGQPVAEVRRYAYHRKFPVNLFFSKVADEQWQLFADWNGTISPVGPTYANYPRLLEDIDNWPQNEQAFFQYANAMRDKQRRLAKRFEKNRAADRARTKREKADALRRHKKENPNAQMIAELEALRRENEARAAREGRAQMPADSGPQIPGPPPEGAHLYRYFNNRGNGEDPEFIKYARVGKRWQGYDMHHPNGVVPIGPSFASEAALVRVFDLQPRERESFLWASNLLAQRAAEQAAPPRARRARKATRGAEQPVLAVMLNPKTFDLVSVYKKGENFRIGFWNHPEKCIGAAYTAETEHYDGEDLVRIHSPSPCNYDGTVEARREWADFSQKLAGTDPEYRGKGFGFLLYAGAAAGVFQRRNDAIGVFSMSKTRSEDADELWDRLVQKKIAKRTYTEVQNEEGCPTEEIEHCEEITKSEVRYQRHDYLIVDGSVCGQVRAQDSDCSETEERTVEYIDGEDMIKAPFTLWSEKSGVNEAFPVDMIARVNVGSKDDAKALAELLKDHTDLHAAFMARDDVKQLLGRKRKAKLAGPERGGTPPLSRESKKLIALFDNLDGAPSRTGTRLAIAAGVGAAVLFGFLFFPRVTA